MFFIILGMLLHRLTIFFLRNKYANRKKIISDYIFECIQDPGKFDLKQYPGSKKWNLQLLQNLEMYDTTIKGAEWDSLKQKFVSSFLIDQARAYYKSFFWGRRHFSSRVLALFAESRDEEILLKMMEDKELLVKECASIAAMRMNSKKAIERALYGIADEKGYTYFFYQDILLQSSKEGFQVMVELANKPELHLSVLRVLSGQCWLAEIPFVKQDLESTILEVRCLALKILIQNPLEEGAQYFQKALLESDLTILEVALKAILRIRLDSFLEPLQKLFSHPSWKIRFLAGKALKQMGGKGLEFLKSQTEPSLIKAAEYVMVFE